MTFAVSMNCDTMINFGFQGPCPMSSSRRFIMLES